MTKATEAIGLSLAFIVGSIVMAVLFMLFIAAGPNLETRYGKAIIKATHVADTVLRNGQQLCWKTRFEKFTSRLPERFDYHVNYQGFEIGVFSYRLLPDGTKVPLSKRGFADHKPGEVWVSLYCIDLPETVKPNTMFIVEGMATYPSATGLWFVSFPLPSFAVPGSL